MNDFRPDIWFLQANFDINGLIAALKSPDAAIRKRSAAALRAMGASEAIPHIKTALENESDPETRSNLLSALAALDVRKGDTQPLVGLEKKPDEIDEMIAVLKGSDSTAIGETARKLMESKDKRAVDALVVAFNNTALDVDVRLMLAEALLALDSAPVEVALLGALRSANWRVRRNGAAILGQMQADWAVKPLGKALKDENDIVRRTALAALKRINTPQAQEILGKRPLTRPLDADPSTAPTRMKKPSGLLNKLRETQENNAVEGTSPSSSAALDAAVPDATVPEDAAAPEDAATSGAVPDAAAPESNTNGAAPPLGEFKAIHWPKRNDPLPDTKPLDPQKLRRLRKTGALGDTGEENNDTSEGKQQD